MGSLDEESGRVEERSSTPFVVLSDAFTGKCLCGRNIGYEDPRNQTQYCLSMDWVQVLFGSTRN